LPQDPTGSGASSSSSSSDLAESDERNDEDDGDDDEDDDGTTPTSLTTGITTDHTSNTHKHDEDHYESVVNDEICALEYLGTQQRFAAVPRSECVETALMNEPMTRALGDSGSSDNSANSLDDLCGHRLAAARAIDRDGRHEATGNARDHYMVPTQDPRELNERILSLFNPQFLPNFNDMITYVTAPISSPPPPRSHRSVDDGLLIKNTNYRKRGGTNSMCFRRGLTYEAQRK
jgi:hypothetical protein